MSTGLLEHVEKSNNKYIEKVRQVDYYQELYLDARSTKYKIKKTYMKYDFPIRNKGLMQHNAASQRAFDGKWESANEVV
jgi:hypothetical protein